MNPLATGFSEDDEQPEQNHSDEEGRHERIAETNIDEKSRIPADWTGPAGILNAAEISEDSGAPISFPNLEPD